MGQPITVKADTVGDVTVFDTDRSITGQDGTGFERTVEIADGADFPARLARRIFDSDDAVDHVFIASNVVTVRRSGGWDSEEVELIAGVIARFFVFYAG